MDRQDSIFHRQHDDAGTAQVTSDLLLASAGTASASASATETTAATTGRAAVAGALALGVAACGSGGGSGTSTGGPPVPTVVKPQNDAEAARFLLQASLSASTATIEAVRSEGYVPWLNRQMSAANDQSGREFLAASGYDRVDANRFYDGFVTGDYMAWSQFLAGGNAVRKRIAFALSQFFVVGLSGLNMTRRLPNIGTSSTATPSAISATSCRTSP
jgi:hypothetical protein